MNKKLILIGLFAAFSISEGNAEINVKLPAGSRVDELEVNHFLLSNLINAKEQRDLNQLEEKIKISGDEAMFKNDESGAAQYIINLPGEEKVGFYASPDDNILVEITSLSPLIANVTGSPLMDGITLIETESEPLVKRRKEMMNGTPDKGAMESLYEEYNEILTDFIKENPTSPAVAYALLKIDSDSFDEYFSKMSEGAKSSILYPFVERRKNKLDQQREQEQKQQELADGHHKAPGFTLNDLEGKPVSLSEFKGKWVVLDFWGSWCIWCIKGFPELKEAYSKYSGKLEIIGIDCQETEEAWRAGVKKYELPWVNVYVPKDNTLTREYGVQGFPTKAIINPEGNIVDITTGHDPEFFTRLDNFLAE